MSVQAVVTAPVSSVRLTVDNWAVVQSLMVQVQGFIEVLISKICSASAPISISHGLQSLTSSLLQRTVLHKWLLLTGTSWR
jgi:hypothetical protein